jgi:hypothetical protein
MFETVALIITAGTAGAGYVGSKRFVQQRLRFVDEVQKPAAAVVAGAVATLAAAPVVALLPLVGTGTALVFGLAVYAGTRAGAKAIKRWIGG